MTRNGDFKQVVRRRMAETGEGYATALAAVRETPPPERAPYEVPYDAVPHDEAAEEARRDQERIVARLFTDGRIARVPAKRKTRAAVLLEVLRRFEPGREYAEKEVDAILLGVHEDFAYLRRELVNYHYLQREGGRYRTAAAPPERMPVEHQEIPAWEAVWLPGFLAGRT